VIFSNTEKELLKRLPFEKLERMDIYESKMFKDYYRHGKSFSSFTTACKIPEELVFFFRAYWQDYLVNDYILDYQDKMTLLEFIVGATELSELVS